MTEFSQQYSSSRNLTSVHTDHCYAYNIFPQVHSNNSVGARILTTAVFLTPHVITCSLSALCEYNHSLCAQIYTLHWSMTPHITKIYSVFICILSLSDSFLWANFFTVAGIVYVIQRYCWCCCSMVLLMLLLDCHDRTRPKSLVGHIGPQPWSRVRIPVLTVHWNHTHWPFNVLSSV